jgi:hypothetical protein
VTAEEGALALIEGDLAIDTAGVAKPTREEPHFSLLVALPVPVDAQVAEVHLHDFSRDRRAQDHRGGKLGKAVVNPPPHRGFAHLHSHRLQKLMNDLEAVLGLQPILDLPFVGLQWARRTVAVAESMLVQPRNLSFAGQLGGRAQPAFPTSQIPNGSDDGLVAAGFPSPSGLVEAVERFPAIPP